MLKQHTPSESDYKTEDVFVADECKYYIKSGNSGILADIDEEIGIKSEIGLFRAVIMQALIDAVNNSKRTEDRIAKAQAREWFSESSADFKMVCELANLNFKWVIKKAMEAIQNDCRWRREVSQSPASKAA